MEKGALMRLKLIQRKDGKDGYVVENVGIGEPDVQVRDGEGLWTGPGLDGVDKGQGTTEYAILVGVLVVIAILAITVFRPKLEELWNAIADGINGL